MAKRKGKKYVISTRRLVKLFWLAFSEKIKLHRNLVKVIAVMLVSNTQ